MYQVPEVTTRRVIITTTTTTTPKPNRDYLPPEEPNREGLLLEADFQDDDKKGEEQNGEFVDPLDDPTKWNLRDSIPGEPGQDYPTLREIPTTDFSCEGRVDGYYADVQTGCQVFHVCSSLAPKSSFLCNNGSIFNQERFTCDWWNKVDCPNSEVNFAKNNDIGKLGVPMPSKESADIDVRALIQPSPAPRRALRPRVEVLAEQQDQSGNALNLAQQTGELVLSSPQPDFRRVPVSTTAQPELFIGSSIRPVEAADDVVLIPAKANPAGRRKVVKQVNRRPVSSTALPEAFPEVLQSLEEVPEQLVEAAFGERIKKKKRLAKE